MDKDSRCTHKVTERNSGAPDSSYDPLGLRSGVRRVWKLSRVLPAILLVSLIATSCSQGGRPTADANHGDVLTVAMPWDSDQPLLKQRTGVNICEPLVRLNRDFQVEPLLATSWEYRGNNTFRFHLRKDVTFHDGTPFTARAVRYSLRQVVKKDLYNSTELGVDSVTIVNKYTVDITPTQPNRRIVEQLGHPGTSIVAPGSNPGQGPVCTGPFKFEKYVPDQRLVVSRYDGYWGNRAKLSKLVVNIVPDDTTRVLGLRSGDVDIIKTVPPQSVKGLARAGFSVEKTQIGATLAMPYNIERADGILSDVRIRRALALSIDRQAIVDGPLAGRGEFVQLLGSPQVLGRHASEIEGLVRDPRRAKALLDQAGWQKNAGGIRYKEGRRLALKLVAFPDVDREAMQLLQAQAKRTGFDINIEFAPDPGTFYEKQEKGRWDLLTYVTNQGDGSPTQKLQAHVTGASFGEWSQPGPRFDRLAREARSTPDLAKAQQKAARAQEILIKDYVAILPLAGIHRIWATKRGVTGFTPHPNWLYQHWESVSWGSASKGEIE